MSPQYRLRIGEIRVFYDVVEPEVQILAVVEKSQAADWLTRFGETHSWGATWVDIVGGLSQSCDDHSDSFFGPDSGEWHGCLSGNQTQVSSGEKQIASINQWFDRWPLGTYNGAYSPDTLNGYIDATFYMRDPYATVYDLDGCGIYQDVGTMFWGNFPVQSTLVSGHPYDTGAGVVVFELMGGAGLSCSSVEDECQTVVCADLGVRKRLTCYWTIPPENNCGNGVCDSGEDCNNCFGDCASQCPP